MPSENFRPHEGLLLRRAKASFEATNRSSFTALRSGPNANQVSIESLATRIFGALDLAGCSSYRV
jgi:hypothetical protein